MDFFVFLRTYEKKPLQINAAALSKEVIGNGCPLTPSTPWLDCTRCTRCASDRRFEVCGILPVIAIFNVTEREKSAAN